MAHAGLLRVLCGTVFVTSPAALLDRLTPGWMNGTFWAVVILIYYLAATLLPIDKLISKLYPVFGVLLMGMAAAVIGGVLFSGGRFTIPEFSLRNLHPKGTPVWPYMFITVACGAISGFHATQSPMIAKCIESERVGRKVFYGAMISEAVIALWVATAYLVRRGRRPWDSLLTALPAAFMSAVSVTYILTASEGFRLGIRPSCILGAAVALGLFVLYLVLMRRSGRSNRQGNDTLS